jgi:hypothetical protein
MLTPLLRLRQHQPRSLLELRAEALMGERLAMGATLPLQLTVFVTDPHAFFEVLRETAADEGATTNAAQFFQKKNEEAEKKKRGRKKPTTAAQAAFELLQWAEYGDVPDFRAAKKEEETSGDDDDDDDDGIELKEEDFETESAAESTAKGKELQQSVAEESMKHWSTQLPEEEDPVGLADGISLRPYQKQALHFMLQREQTGASRDELEEQLALMAELSANASNNHKSGVAAVFPAGSQMDIVCDRGPVVVSEEGRKKAKTLDGEVNPVSHPLWKR